LKRFKKIYSYILKILSYFERNKTIVVRSNKKGFVFLIEEDFLVLIRYVKTYCKLKKIAVPGGEDFYKEIYEKHNHKLEYDFNNSYIEEIMLKAYQILYRNKEINPPADVEKIFYKYVDMLIKLKI
jgi:hypothetical protein